MSGIFSFGGHRIRVFGTPEEPWFVAKDVCAALGIKNSRQACKSLPNHHKTRKQSTGVTDNDTSRPHSSPQNYLCVTASGLYTLSFKSIKPEAVKFKLWISDEVLPSIQRNGFYDKKQRVSEEPLFSDTVDEGVEQIFEKALDKLEKRIDSRLDLVFDAVKGIKGAVRKKPTTTTMKMHMNTINKYYNRRCPCCGDTVIIGPNGKHIGEVDHWVKVTMAAAQHTWPVCKACNNKFLTQYLKEESRKFFEVYQERLRQANSDHQIKLFDEERIS